MKTARKKAGANKHRHFGFAKGGEFS